MNSNQVKTAFAASGIRVRVADLGLKFRVCTMGDVAFNKEAAKTVAASIGLTDCFAVAGAQFNQAHEMVAFKPGAIRRG